MLKAGFVKVDITPGRDLSLMGYEFRQTSLPPGNDGVHDPLFARALVLDDGSGPAAILALDLAVTTNALARRLRAAVADALSTEAERVIVACTHTHSGPDLYDLHYTDAGTLEVGEVDPERDDSPTARYLRDLTVKASEAAARAGGPLYPVRASVREAPLGIGYNRRVRTDEGVRHCWNPQEQFDLDPPPMPDPTCTVLLLEQVGGPRRYVLWSAGAHGVALGKTSRVVSGDWPGLACGMIEDLVPGGRAMFLAGASGNVHPWIATQESPEGALAVARAAASFVALVSQATRGGGDDLAVISRTVEIGRRELDLAAWRIGPCRLLAAPVELFQEPALTLRQRVGGPLVLATNANGWTGYWPTAEAYEEGGYEIELAKDLADRMPDGTERLIDELAALAEALD